MNPETPANPVPAPAPQTAPAATNPGGWPGAFGAYKLSKQTIKPNIWTIVSLYGLAVLLSIVLGIVFPSHTTDPFSSNDSLRNLIELLFNVVLIGATTHVYLSSTRGQHVPLSESLKKGVSLFLPILGWLLLLYVLLGVSLLLFVIPFFFVLPRLAQSPYYLVDKNLGPIEALKQSWAQTKGHSGKVWGIIGATIVMALPVITIIGIPVALYLIVMYSAAPVLLYRFISGAAPTPPVAAAPAPATPETPPTPPVVTDVPSDNQSPPTPAAPAA